MDCDHNLDQCNMCNNANRREYSLWCDVLALFYDLSNWLNIVDS